MKRRLYLKDALTQTKEKKNYEKTTYPNLVHNGALIVLIIF